MQDPSEWKLSTPGGIPVKLIRQWGRFSREDATWNMELCIRSHDLVPFLQECFPSPTVLGTLVFYPRRFYPAGLPALECKEVSVEEFTSGRPIDPFAAGTSLYSPQEYAKTFEPYLRVTVTFGPSPANSQERDPSNPFTFLEISASAAGEFLTSEINQDAVEWKTPGGGFESPDEKDAAVYQRVRSLEVQWSCKWPQVPFDFFYSVLKPRLHEALGKVNKSPMPIFGNAPAHTILFLDYKTSQEHTWREGYAGTSPVEVTMDFVEKNFKGLAKSSTGDWQTVQVTHYHIWRPNRGWAELYIDEKPMYDSYDLNKIFG